MTNTRLRYGQCEGLPEPSPTISKLAQWRGRSVFRRARSPLRQDAPEDAGGGTQARQCVGGDLPAAEARSGDGVAVFKQTKSDFSHTTADLWMLCAQLHRHLMQMSGVASGEKQSRSLRLVPAVVML